jgi:KDO2-lipid IV(A) lauroyltransferase
MPGAPEAYVLAQWGSRLLPAPVSQWLIEQLADAQWRSRPDLCRQVAHNLSLNQEDVVPPQSALVREVFRNFGRYLVEFFSMHRHRPHVTIEGRDHLAALQRAGTGAILLSAHLGNWELGAVTLNRLGPGLTAVVRPHADRRIDGLFTGQRRRCGLETIALGAGARGQALSVLRNRRWLGLVADRDFTGHNVAVTWGRHRLLLPSGPALLSLQAQVPAVPVFFVREGAGRFRLIIEPPLQPPAWRRRLADVAGLTQRYAEALRRQVQHYASQWLLFEPLPEAS